VADPAKINKRLDGDRFTLMPVRDVHARLEEPRFAGTLTVDCSRPFGAGRSTMMSWHGLISNIEWGAWALKRHMKRRRRKIGSGVRIRSRGVLRCILMFLGLLLELE
jgi:hypothetical protein